MYPSLNSGTELQYPCQTPASDSKTKNIFYQTNQITESHCPIKWRRVDEFNVYPRYSVSWAVTRISEFPNNAPSGRSLLSLPPNTLPVNTPFLAWALRASIFSNSRKGVAPLYLEGYSQTTAYGNASGGCFEFQLCTKGPRTLLVIVWGRG